MPSKLLSSIIVAALCLECHHAGAADPLTGEVDVCVYGGTSAGVTAAAQAGRMGRSVVLIEPGKHLGGLSSSGLGMTDNGATHTIGGLAREFYERWLERAAPDRKCSGEYVAGVIEKFVTAVAVKAQRDAR